MGKCGLSPQSCRCPEVDLNQARRLLSEIPNHARVLDVGGGASPFPRADHVIDALPFDAAGAGSSGSSHKVLNVLPRYSRERWTQFDLCSHQPWPFADKSFDFAVCTHVLEDVRDPIWICSELSRVAHAGYIEVPSRVLEQSRGVEHPRIAGYSHHRWLISKSGHTLEFRHKPHVLNALNHAIVVDLPPGRIITPAHAIVSHDWVGRVEAQEIMEFNEKAVLDELCSFASDARRLSNLTTTIPMPLLRRIKRHLYFWRLARGHR